MFLTMFLLGAVYVAFFVVLLQLFDLGLFAVVLIMGGLAFLQYFTSDKIALAAAGAKVVVTELPDRLERAEATALAIRARQSAEAAAVPLDVTDLGSIRVCAEAAADAYGGRIDVLVNNAGLNVPQKAFDVTEEAWDRVLDVNLRGTFIGAQVARPFLSEGGSLVLISSICASQGFAARAAYCASKAGVDGLVRSLAMEWGPDGIRVNGVAPGTIETEMQKAMVASGRVSVQRYLDRIPMNRVGRPEEIADAVAYLASERASYISGVILAVDGGWAGGGLPAQA
jgi:NAD(P)-dependent dehydrogenase (short-subunit alcohol dehydrogenase family)